MRVLVRSNYQRSTQKRHSPHNNKRNWTCKNKSRFKEWRHRYDWGRTLAWIPIQVRSNNIVKDSAKNLVNVRNIAIVRKRSWARILIVVLSSSFSRTLWVLQRVEGPSNWIIRLTLIETPATDTMKEPSKEMATSPSISYAQVLMGPRSKSSDKTQNRRSWMSRS